MSKCPDCGIEIEPGKTRCPFCGKRVVAEHKAAMIRRVQAFIDDEGHLRLALSNCRECGAEMTFNEEKLQFECAYCGAVAIIPEALESFTLAAMTGNEPEDDWDYSRTPEELPSRAVSFRYSCEELEQNIKTYFELLHDNGSWFRKESAILQRIDQCIVPFFNFTAKATTTWDSPSINQSLLRIFKQEGFWSEMKTAADNTDITKTDYSEYLLQADEFETPLGEQYSPRLWKQTIDAPLLKDCPAPPDGWPKPAIDFSQASILVQTLIPRLERHFHRLMKRALQRSFYCETEVKVRSGFLIYLPVWRVTFLIDKALHTITFSGVTGQDLFSTYKQ